MAKTHEEIIQLDVKLTQGPRTHAEDLFVDVTLTQGPRVHDIFMQIEVVPNGSISVTNGPSVQII